MVLDLLSSRGRSSRGCCSHCEFCDAFAIGGGADADVTKKRATHRLSRPGSNERRNLFDRPSGIFQPSASRFDARRFKRLACPFLRQAVVY
jgi:hypothetical protein